MRIAIDMDEVLADTGQAQREIYRELFGYDWSDEELRGVEMHELAEPDHAEYLTRLKDEGHIFATLGVIEGAQKAVADLIEEHEIVIATAAMEHPASCLPKVHWLQRNFPMIDRMNVMLVGQKGAVHADVLIDDHSRHFERFGGRGVLFPALHNADDPHPVKISGWHEAPELIARIAEERG